MFMFPHLGRGHIVWSAIFVAKNPSAFLIYDFPIEKHYRSEKILKANIYHISKYIG